MIVTPITMRGRHCQAALSLPCCHPEAQPDRVTPGHWPPLRSACYLQQLLTFVSKDKSLYGTQTASPKLNNWINYNNNKATTLNSCFAWLSAELYDQSKFMPSWLLMCDWHNSPRSFPIWFLLSVSNILNSFPLGSHRLSSFVWRFGRSLNFSCWFCISYHFVCDDRTSVLAVFVSLVILSGVVCQHSFSSIIRSFSSHKSEFQKRTSDTIWHPIDST